MVRAMGDRFSGERSGVILLTTSLYGNFIRVECAGAKIEEERLKIEEGGEERKKEEMKRRRKKKMKKTGGAWQTYFCVRSIQGRTWGLLGALGKDYYRIEGSSQP